jgi:autotransporter-associated beta strand protein
MVFSSSRRNRKAASARPLPRPAPRPSFRPRLETLEDRVAPATVVWDGGSLLNSNWTTAANWVGDVAPVPGVDDLEFPSTAARKANTNDFAGATFRITFTGSNYILGGNPLTLGGNLTTGPGAVNDFLSLNLSLNGDRTFQLGAGSVLTINGVIGGAGGFTKIGAGLLVLRGANTYAGLTQANESTINVENSSALGSTTGGTVIAKGAAIRLINIPSPAVFAPEPLTFGPGPSGPEATLINSISDATWTGPVTFESGGNRLVAEATRTLRFTGAIGGPGGFRHITTGVLEFAGTAPNTYGGTTEFARGTLKLNKTAGVTAIPGALQIGTNDASAGVVTLMAAQQIADSSAVTFAGGSGFFGTLNLNGFAETVGSLSGTGGHVLLGGGVLTTGANGTSTTFGGDITGAGGLAKVGAGTFTLTGASTYSGPTSVRAGTLRVNGSLASAVTVSGSGTLSGSGTTGAVMAAPGVTVSPGVTGPGILTAAGNVALGAGSSFVVELNGTAPGSGYDQLRVTGAASTVRLGGTLSVRLGFAPAGQSFTIINNAGSSPVSGTFNGLPEGALVRAGSSTFHISYQGGDGSEVVLTQIPGPAPGDIEWLNQFNAFAPALARAWAVAAVGDAVYVVGDIDGTLPGQTSAGATDAFVRKYDLDGNEVWTRQFGTSSNDAATGVAVDTSLGVPGVYVAGNTSGTFPGLASAGGVDAFVRKYDFDGNELWTSQFGTTSGDGVSGIAVQNASVFVAGSTAGTLPGQTSAGGLDAFVRKYYGGNGHEIWTRQFGTDGDDVAQGVAVHRDGVYVAGNTSGTFQDQTSAGDLDAFVRKYDADDGTERWTSQFGTSAADGARGVAAGDGTGIDDGGDTVVYVAGGTFGTLPGQTSAGDEDAFVRKYKDVIVPESVDVDGSDDGVELWTSQFGTPSEDKATGVAVQDLTVYVAGETFGVLPGQTSAGGLDAFVRECSTDSGDEFHTRQFGTSSNDGATGVDVSSGVYVTGEIVTFLEHTPDRSTDAFVSTYGGGTDWTSRFSSFSPQFDSAQAVVSADGSVYVAGYTDGILPGQTGAGGRDAFVRKYDSAGNELWTSQFGSAARDEAVALAVDASGVYVAGLTLGTLPGQASSGFVDAFVRRYDADGNEIWTIQFGTSSADAASGVAVDASGVYVVGSTDGTFPGQTSLGESDAFVRKYDFAGNELWTRQFGTSDLDSANGIAVDASGVYVVGDTYGTFPGQTHAGGFTDAYVRKYDVAGNELWTHEFGSSGPDTAFGVAADGSGVYVAGRTGGTLPGQVSAGLDDAFVRKYDADGTELWTRQFGTLGVDVAFGVAADSSGVYVAGETNATLSGQASAGGDDAFVRKYDAAGNVVWTRQLGTSGSDTAAGVAVDASGIYVAGEASGIFPGQDSPGGRDAFVAKLNGNTPAMFPNRRVTSPLRESHYVVVSGTISDPDRLDTFFLDVSWGDGTPPQTYTFPPGTPRDVNISHRYAHHGTYTIVLAWRDQHGAGNRGTLSVTVPNVPPHLKHLHLTEPAVAGQAATLTASIPDPGTRDTFRLVVDWGDGSGKETLDYPAGTTDLALRHRFRQPGRYRVTLTLFDEDGGSWEAHLFVKVRAPR